MSYIRRKSNNPVYELLRVKHGTPGKGRRKRAATETTEISYKIRRPKLNTDLVEISEKNNLEFIEEMKAILLFSKINMTALKFVNIYNINILYITLNFFLIMIILNIIIYIYIYIYISNDLLNTI